jgi:hypothetical protein
MLHPFADQLEGRVPAKDTEERDNVRVMKQLPDDGLLPPHLSRIIRHKSPNGEGGAYSLIHLDPLIIGADRLERDHAALILRPVHVRHARLAYRRGRVLDEGLLNLEERGEVWRTLAQRA